MQTKARGALGFEETHPPLTAEQVDIEAGRCLQCGGPLAPAPCIAACPAGVDIPRFIGEIRCGALLDAAMTVYAANSLGGSCGRVCPADELCQSACVMGKEGRRPVEIAALHRFATEAALKQLKPEERAKPPRHNGLSVGIVGAGPAGLACAEELACLGYEVTVYEKRTLPGGLITYGIAPYKQRIEPMFEEAERIAGIGIRIRFGLEIGSDIPVSELEAEHDAIFLGIGMGPDQPAGIPGEDLNGIFDSLPFIQEVKLGKPERLRLAGKRVAVVGGGNTAIDVARELIRLGVQDATIVYRRDEASMPAYRHEVEAAKSEGVQFVFLATPVRFLGKKAVSGIECQRVRLETADGSGRPRPVPVSGSEFVVECDAAVKAIGQRPLEETLSLFDAKAEGGRLEVDAAFRTSNPWVYAGGDVVTGGTTAVDSVRQGKMAAQSIDSVLQGKPRIWPQTRKEAPARTKTEGPFVKFYQGDCYLGTAPALCKGCNLCVNSCPAEILSLDDKAKIQVKDVDKCLFCGICEMRCPDFAIWIVKGDPRPHSAEFEARRRLTL